MRQKTVQMKAIVTLMMFFFIGFLIVACGGDDEVFTHTVSFDSGGGSAMDSIEVETGRRITNPGEPSRDDGFEFIGWFKDSDFTSHWDFAVDIVTDDVTLYAHWRRVEPFPTEVGMTDDAFSSSMQWVQTGITNNTEFTVTLYAGTPTVDPYGNDTFEYEEVGMVVSGSHTLLDETTIVWTPDEAIQGGVYKVVILTDGNEAVEVRDLPFKGEGTLDNPFLLYDSKDIANIANNDEVGLGKYYEMRTDITHESSYTNIQGNRFLGTFDGNGFEITISGNAGLFFELEESALIHNLTIRGTLLTGTTPLIASIAHENRGTIRDTVSWTLITSSAGEVGNPDSKYEGGAGGLVGINHEEGLIESCMYRSSGSSIGVLKANVGGGGIVSINYGTISGCENRGALGAFNAVESGRTLSRYSYMGGIAGFNYGVIEQSNTTSVGKLLAQRYWNVEPPEGTGNNRVIGGIVGYNGPEGIIRESYFNGIRVHGDQYVGGIAGINAGLISDSYVGARYYAALNGRSYVGGRVNVGGIAGFLEGDGRIENSYAAINVYAYEDTPYAIASEAFDSVYIETNHDPRAIGDQEYGNVDTDILAPPTGSNNTAVSNTPLNPGDGVFYELPGSFADILGEAFINDDDHTKLLWEIDD